MGPILVNLGRVLLALGIGTVGSWFGGSETVVDDDGGPSPKGTYLIVGVTAILSMAAMYFICKKFR